MIFSRVVPPMRRSVATCVMFGLMCVAWNWFDVVDEDVEKGNQAFAARRFDKALLAYERALERSSDNGRIFYNIGVVLYELARVGGGAGSEKSAGRPLLDRAAAAFARAAHVSEEQGDTSLAAMAYFGHGNALYRASRYPDAVHAYQNALRANPKHDDARYNLQIAQAHLDEHRQPGAHGPAPRHQAPEREQDSDSGSSGSPGAYGGEEDSRQRSGDTAGGRDARQSGGATGQDSDAVGNKRSEAPSRSRERGSGQTSGSRADTSGADGNAGEGGDGGDTATQGMSLPGSGGAKSSSQADLDKKLDALERLSRDLRHDKLRRDTHGAQDGRVERDW